MPTRAARSDCAAVGGFAAYGCGVPLAGKRNARKEELVKYVLAPRLKMHRAAGTNDQACTVPRRARRPVLANPQAPSHADSRTARRHEGAGARQKAFFSFGPCTARFLFGKTKYGAPAAPCAVGRGGAPKPTKWARKCPWGARERAQFSPQAETELSGLCDDAMGGASPVETAPCGSRDHRGRCPAARLRQGLPYFKNSSTTPSMPGFSQVRSNRRALPFRAARRRGMAVPVTSCS